MTHPRSRLVPHGAAPFLIALAAALAGCSSESSSEPDGGGGIANPDPVAECRDISAIEGGGRRQKLSGIVTEVDADGALTIGGVRIATQGAQILIDGVEATLTDLDVGQAVTVRGELDLGSRTGCASEVVADAVIVGAIDSLDVSGRSFTILGQQVRVAAETVFGNGGSLDSLNTGHRIRVSGMLSLGSIVASRIDTTELPEGYFISGTVTGLDVSRQTFLVNSVLVDYGQAVQFGLVGGLLDGASVRVWGTDFEVAGGSPDSTVLRPARIDLMSLGLTVSPSPPVSLTPGFSMQFSAWGILGPVTWTVTGSDGSACDPSACGRIDSTGRYTAPTIVTPPSGVLVTAASVADPNVRASAAVFVTQTGHVFPGEHTLSGEVFEAGGPLADAAVDIWVQKPRDGYSYWWSHGPLYTNGGGSFEAPGLPDSLVSVFVVAQGYAQPCAVTPEIRGDTSVRVELMPLEVFDSANPPRPTLAVEPSVTGEIYEMTDSGRHVIAGASIWLEDPFGISYANTLSDLGGRYYICNIDSIPTWGWLTVAKPGFELRTVGPVDSPDSITMDVELERLPDD